MSHRHDHMSFATWVDTQVHHLRAPRLQVIMKYLEAFGPNISDNIRTHLASAGACERVPASTRAWTRVTTPTRVWAYVTLDTVLADLALLIHAGYVMAVDHSDKARTRGKYRQRVWRYRLTSGAL